MTYDEICRRASGRRHYNAMRRRRAAARLDQVRELIGTDATMRQIAQRLGVSEATISRDCTRLWLERYADESELARMTQAQISAKIVQWFGR